MSLLLALLALLFGGFGLTAGTGGSAPDLGPPRGTYTYSVPTPEAPAPPPPPRRRRAGGAFHPHFA